MAVAPSSHTKPTFVLVSGAWHGTGYWAKVVAGLESEGYRVVPVALRSASPDPDITFLDDLTAVRDVIRGEVTQGCDVVVVAHSFGTVVGASAIKGFAASSKLRADNGQSGKTAITGDGTGVQNGHVIGFVAVGTGFMPTGVCFLQALGGKPPPLWRFSSEPLVTTDDYDVDDDGENTTKAFATIRVSARDALYNDLPTEEGEQWVERLVPQSAGTIAQGDEHVYAGWLDVPSWSLITTEDRAFPPEDQKASSQAARDAGANIWGEEIEASHSPMLSRPVETAEFLRRAAVAFGEKAAASQRK
ncbi:hypothetical protein PG993_013312 [Apiospora rasikravindrae]|uniref:AB hydrolase-1 domain-containing protein n=1 Tax=Apiospora rasikravindrae TaxID=990691 RepID=A0ABR1RX96_9PEZI